jgi:hypothetical protein
MATWELLFRNVVSKPVKYTRSIISYLDILGFQDLIETKTPGEISQLLLILAESVQPSQMFKQEKIQFTKFSDTVIRSMPESKHYPRNFLFELRSILYAQIALVPRGVVVRGAVTIGEIVQSWKVVFGPGVVQAYKLESQEGSPPRIVIDSKTIESIRPSLEKEDLLSELESLVCVDETVSFLDYLSACERELNVPEQEYSLFLAHHRDLIRSNLKRHSGRPKVRSKYEWLESYHQRTLAKRFGKIPENLSI